MGKWITKHESTFKEKDKGRENNERKHGQEKKMYEYTRVRTVVQGWEFMGNNLLISNGFALLLTYWGPQPLPWNFFVQISENAPYINDKMLNDKMEYMMQIFNSSSLTADFCKT
jgi:hypothetical protein